MAVSSRRLLRLYPRAWRERYGDELLALLDARAITPAIAIDVVLGALREWGRAIVRQPGAPIDLKRERWRNAVVTLLGTVVVWTICNLLADQVRQPWIVLSDSKWLYDLPGFVALIRALQIKFRRGKILKRATLAGLPAPHDAAIAAGMTRAEFWCWMPCLIQFWTSLVLDRPTGFLHNFSHFYLIGFNLYMFRTSTKSGYARKVQLDELARRAKVSS